MEVRKVVEDVQGFNGGSMSVGTLRLTDFHLVFCARTPLEKDLQPAGDQPKVIESWIPYPLFSYCTLRPAPPASASRSAIRLRCRDFTFVTLTFKTDLIAREVFDFLKLRTCRLGSIDKLYAFRHIALDTERAINGWNLYDPRAEFRRQGISEKDADRGWRISHVNCDYSFCDTYPALLLVPSNISDNVLKYAKEFRSRNRIPVLTYIHPINNCTITRSSQPLAGLTRKTNVQDEKLVAASFSAFSVHSASQEPSPVTSQNDSPAPVESNVSDVDRCEDDFINAAALYDEKTGKRLIYGAQQSNLIVDARPTINAMVNQMQGYGSENMDKYKFARKTFLSIENIHVMRNSLNKVLAAIKDADLSTLPPDRDLLAQSGWIKHIQEILTGAATITRQIGIKHSNVLIHCSDGWDRTSQLSALSQLMLDPYYRTIQGFIVLIEKDWLSFGHMFRLRSGPLNHESWFAVQKDAMAGVPVQPGETDGRNDAFQSAIASAKRFFNQSKDEAELDPAAGEISSGRIENDEATVPKMVSPVFHQFLDSVYQLLRQNPTRFEFNERFLRRLLYHLYSCQYGTFLFNSEKQRHDACAQVCTSSVWDYFLSRRPEFTNTEYENSIDDHVKGRERIILPKLKEIRWWHQLFNRTDAEMNATLDAAAMAESDRAVAMASILAQPVSRGETGSPPKPANASSGLHLPVFSGLATMETVPSGKATFTTASESMLPLNTSAATESPSAFTTMREGLAGLGLARAMLGGGRGSVNGVPVPARTDQELREMT